MWLQGLNHGLLKACFVGWRLGLGARDRRTGSGVGIRSAGTRAPLQGTGGGGAAAWTWWFEGGPQGLAGGDPYVAGFGAPGSAFAAPPKKWGWDLAGAVDYRFDGYWHLSAGFRYGTNKKRTSTHNPRANWLTNAILSTLGGVVTVTTPATVNVNGTGSAERKEHNWSADFMVGRDIGLGSGNSQLKVGIRVAEIRGKTTGSAQWIVPVAPSTTATVANAQINRNYEQTNKFLGVGPRLALEGGVPLGAAWSVDYMGGVAALYGNRKVDQTGSGTATVTGFPFVAAFIPTCVSGCPVAASSSSKGFVFNTDAMLGLSYALTQNMKLSVNYRVDAYFNAMRVIDTAGNASNTNRIYHGPNMRLTIAY